MTLHKGIEAVECESYLSESVDELGFESWLTRRPQSFGLIAAQGFEERSVGIIESCAKSGFRVASLALGCHQVHQAANDKFQGRFEKAATTISSKPWLTPRIDPDGQWIRTAIQSIACDDIVLDITGIGTRGLFGALDAAVASGKSITLAYAEASQYWPTRDDWIVLKNELTEPSILPETVNEKPWLFSYEHTVELIPNHEGYDSAGGERALVGFLPFKCARLAAVLGAEDYADFLFIAGKPRLDENLWRYEALLEINANIVKERPVLQMSTFAYRTALAQLSETLLGERALLEKYDVHLALMGSKLQDVACWIFSCLVPSLTVLTAVPSHYYPEAFSEGIGQQWMLPLTSPKRY